MLKIQSGTRENEELFQRSESKQTSPSASSHTGKAGYFFQKEMLIITLITLVTIE
jgi:hypothetical protein